MQMKQGGVVFQALAIFTITRKGSVRIAREQYEIYTQLQGNFPAAFGPSRIEILPALENASGICEEDELLEEGFRRLEKMLPLLYISMTWNDENRFGGGNASSIGLKPDGEKLLQWMSEKNIAIDLSHTSDALAKDILNYIEKKNLKVRVIASHSNFRAVSDFPRNLPDEIAQEIGKRKGLIGLNFVHRFMGNGLPSDFLRQIEQASKLGLMDNLCLGADFFDDREVSPRPYHADFGNSSCYPRFFQCVGEKFPADSLEKIGYKNIWRFLGR
jgi:microsomal dipeptidase-like Zn-dependent dipeptidase